MKAKIYERTYHNKDVPGKRDFYEKNLNRHHFKNCNLTGADFRMADLKFTDFHDSDLTAADFRGADVRYAHFTHANLRGANFTGAHIEHATFPDGFDPSKVELVFIRASRFFPEQK